jgi:mono/diheme cytochrome c family protein
VSVDRRSWGLCVLVLVLLPLLASATPPAATKAVSRKPVVEDELEVPAAERERKNPVAVSADALRAGRFQWKEHCETCHGTQGRGDGPNARLHERRKGHAPRNLTEVEVQENLTDGEIFWRISKGIIEGETIIMPAFAEKIPSETHRWQLVLYVRELGRIRSR